MIKAAYQSGVDAARGMYKLSDERNDRDSSEPGWLRRHAVPLAGLAAAAGTYGLARKFRPSANKALARLQQAAKDKNFVVATSGDPDVRRSMIYGAKNVADRPSGAGFQEHYPDTALLHQANVSQPKTKGDVTINTGVLPGALDDKYIFHRIMTEGTGGGKGLEGAVPRTHLLGDVLAKYRGVPYEKLHEQLGHDFIIKPREGSMSKADALLSNATPLSEPRLQQALRNPDAHILQEKLPIQREFRVHTINGVPFTASHRWIPHEGLRNRWNAFTKKHFGAAGGGGGAFIPVMGDDRKKLMDFAQEATKHVGVGPSGENLLGSSENFHHALDIAQLPDGSFKLIESNPSPGTMMNPVTARRLQQMVTGRVPRDVATLGALGAGGAAALGAKYLTKDEQESQS